MGLKIKQCKSKELSTLNPEWYDVIILIDDAGQGYRVMKNKYIEYDDFESYHISKLMDYMVECHSVYNEIYGIELPTQGYI